MKYLIAAAVMAVGLFVTTGTASAQHHGGHHGGTYGHGYTHGGHGYTHGGYAAPRVGVYSGPFDGRSYQPGYGVGVYSRPVYSGPVYGGGYAGHDHHNRHGHH